MAKGKIVPDDGIPSFQFSFKNLSEKIFGRSFGQSVIKRKNAAGGHSEPFEFAQVQPKSLNRWRTTIRRQSSGRVAVKGDDDGGEPLFDGSLDGLPNDFLMPEVDAIERSNTDHAARPFGRRSNESEPNEHERDDTGGRKDEG